MNPKVEAHREICEYLNNLYERKNHDYGDSFHQSFIEEGMAMPRIRLGDKLNRFKTLTLQGGQQVTDESVQDTLLDLANYAIMTVLEMDAARLVEKDNVVQSISFTDRDYAIEILENMRSAIDEFGKVTLSDFLAFSGYESSDKLDDCCGWQNLDDAIVATGDQPLTYKIKLPPVINLKGTLTASSTRRPAPFSRWWGARGRLGATNVISL